MEVDEKRKLLNSIDILVKRPAIADEETLANTLNYFKKLIEEITVNKVEVTYRFKTED